METMESSSKYRYLEDWSDWELISVPMLDTAFDRSEKQAIRAILSRRGIVGRRRFVMCLFAYIGLLYNGLRGEWVSLDLQDIIHGWSLNAFIAAFLLAAIPIFRLVRQHSPFAALVVASVAGVIVGVAAFRFVGSRLRARLGNGA